LSDGADVAGVVEVAAEAILAGGGSAVLRQNQAGSQSALAAFGGYLMPPTSTLGWQVHQSLWLIPLITLGMWLPQPHQDFLPQVSQVPFMHMAAKSLIKPSMLLSN